MGVIDSKIYVCTSCATQIYIPPPPPPILHMHKKLINNSNQNDFYSSGDEKCSNSDSYASTINFEVPSNTLLCRRCHGFLSNNDESGKKKHKRYIEHLHIAPFSDTLRKHSNEEKEIDSEYIINRYLKPYFNKHPNILIKYKHRLIIKNVEFKVIGCYPPAGHVTADTKYHLNGDDGKLIKLTFGPIQQIHFLPIHKSLMIHNNNATNKDKDDASNKLLLHKSLKPYLKGTDKLFYVPDAGDYDDDNSRFYLSDKTLFGDPNCNEETKTDRYPNDKKAKRHLMEQETFIANGIAWRVMKCVPFNGFIDAKTELFCHGEAIKDANKISIRPIYEALPHSHRHFTPTQIKLIYLEPFFRGKCRFIDHSKQVKIFGVDFSIRESEPNEGIVTLNTKIDYMGIAIKAQELENIQQMEDQEMAQKLQKDMEEEQYRERRRMRLNGSLRGRWDDPLGFEFGFDFPWNRPREQKAKKTGVDKEIVERLPIFTFTSSNSRDDQCRICLEYYVEGDTLRILPCFHFYHKECVDTWLIKMSPKCPICNTSILRQQRRNTQ